jgi:hypothetical protein
LYRPAFGGPIYFQDITYKQAMLPIRAFCLIIAILCLASVTASAQTPRVDQYAISTFQAAWSPLDENNAARMTYTAGPNWGNYSIAIPFDFPYDGIVIPHGSVVSVGANGAISLNNDSIPDRPVVGDAMLPMLIGLFSGDLRQGSDVPTNVADTVGFYQISGVQPNRTLTIAYPAFHLRGGGSGIPGQETIVTSAQVKLYEKTGAIEFIYRDHGLDMPTKFPNVRVAIGLNGGTSPTFVSNTYATDTKLVPAADLRFTPEPASVDGSKDIQARFYPNPACEFIDIDLSDDAQVVRAIASDMQGSEYLLGYSNGRIDLKELPIGSYLLTVETNRGSHSERISVLR